MFRVFSAKSESSHSFEDQSPLKSPLKTRCRETDSGSRDSPNSPVVRNVPRHLQRSRSASSGLSPNSFDRYQSPQQSSRRPSPIEGRTSSPLSGSSFTRTRTDPRSHQQYATQSVPLALNDSRQPTFNEPSRSASANSAKHLPPLMECESYDEEGKPTVAESTYSAKREEGEAFSETTSHTVFANRKWDSSKPRRAQPHQRAMTDEPRNSGSPRLKMMDERPGVKYGKEEKLEGENCPS